MCLTVSRIYGSFLRELPNCYRRFRLWRPTDHGVLSGQRELEKSTGISINMFFGVEFPLLGWENVIQLGLNFDFIYRIYQGLEVDDGRVYVPKEMALI